MVSGLCIDLEYWYLDENLRKYLPQGGQDPIEESTELILELLDRHRVKASFFVLGVVAEEHGELVKAIADQGHEIASHAYSHTTLHRLGREGFREEIARSVALLKAATGECPVGFRAPTGSLDNSTRWALEVLQGHGFRYDASIFPVRTPLYGLPGAPLGPYRPDFRDLTREDTNSPLIEFPNTVVSLGIKVPVGGGFYLRALPLWFVKRALRQVTKTRPALVYVHPWELYPRFPHLKGISAFDRFVVYYRLHSTLRKFEALLQEFEFKPLRQVLGV